MNDFQILLSELKPLIKDKPAQVITFDGIEYLIGKTKSGYMVTTEVEGDEYFVGDIK